MTMVELIGWLGAICLLTGFALNLFQVIRSESLTYSFLNLTASVLLLYNAWMNEVFPFVVVNTVWLLFSGYKIITFRFKKAH